ncbi:MAG TPA: rod shape-determining protein RodA [bacterium]|nr:rod shape-determining protein RodA [bacterium]HOR57658.1 rod shape-determining protein RodA [bacterium]HPL56424.1 rod shape-determining protein RodA [bacterium]
MKLSIFKSLDLSLILLPVLLVGVGIATIYSTTLGTEQSYFAWQQGVFAFIGLVLMFVFSFYDYRNLRNVSWVFYVLCIVLLLAVLFVGKKVFGATRWLDFGIFQLQPSELLKIATILFVSSFFAQTVSRWYQRLIMAMVLVGAPLFLVAKQPDLGTTIVVVTIFLSLFFFWPISRKVKIGAVVVLLALLPLSWTLLQDYQRNRIYTFINPGRDPYGAGYNVIQSLIAVGSGGLTGRGLGNGPQSQLNFLPVAHTDFIFAGWAEATGFVGAMGLLLALAFLNWRIYRIASVAKDAYGRYLAIGFGAMISVQIAVNIGMNLGLAPVTGIPLPFVSHGGTALVVDFIMLGVMQSIYIRHRANL